MNEFFKMKKIEKPTGSATVLTTGTGYGWGTGTLTGT